jgi:hypothetical protein
LLVLQATADSRCSAITALATITCISLLFFHVVDLAV